MVLRNRDRRLTRTIFYLPAVVYAATAAYGVWATFAGPCLDNCGLLNWRLSLLWLLPYDRFMPIDPYKSGAVIYTAILVNLWVLILLARWAYGASSGGRDRR